MSDTCFATVNQRIKKIDIIDETWINDRLSDDEIDMPKDVNEIEEEDEDENAPQSDDIWNDAGLEGFAIEPQRNSSKPPLIAIPQQYQQYVSSSSVQDTATTQQTHQHP